MWVHNTCVCTMFRSLLLCVSSLDKTIMNLLSFIWFNAYTCLNIFFFRCGPTRAMTSSFLRFLDHTQRRATFGRTPLGEWSARRRDIYLTTQTLTTNIHVPDGIRTHDLSKRAAADLRLRPRGHWHRQTNSVDCKITWLICLTREPISI